MAAIFEVYLLAVALGALKTALDLTGPWYRGTATLWTYATTFLGSLVLLSVLALAAVVLVRPRGFEGATEIGMSGSPVRTGNPSAALEEEEMQQLLGLLKHAPPPRANPRGGSVATQETAKLASLQPRLEGAIAHPRRVRRVLLTLIGPSLTATAFAALSASLLPGSEGVLQTSFTLNTFFVLFFAYGWVGLLGYSVCSLFLAASEA